MVLWNSMKTSRWLPDAEREIAGHADIKSAIPSAREDVDAWALLGHLRSCGLGPRFREDDEHHFF
jgi:hypothetical protein